MVEQREFQRVMAIVRAHAREALTRHHAQRESFLAYCRNNWKRYAAGVSRRKIEGDRFAAMIDAATRELLALAEAAPNAEAAAEILRGEQPPAWGDSIEGAMDSVIMYEAHQEPEIVPETTEAPVVDARSAMSADEVGAFSSSTSTEQVPAPESAAQINAEEDDRLAARYGFRSPADEAKTPAVERPENAEELQRKVRAVLLAHRPKSSG
jgi:hypothetical protein